MKVAITATGETLNSDIDLRFGRAQNFLIVDTDTMQIDNVTNAQNINAAQGAGIQAAQTIAKTGAEVLITGNCGPKAFGVLSAANIKVIVGVSGKIQDVLESYKQGKLKTVDSSNVEGHWM